MTDDDWPEQDWLTAHPRTHTADDAYGTGLDARAIDNFYAATEPAWTIGDALDFLDPQPPRRTVQRWVKDMPRVGERELPQGGPPAALYPVREVMRAHAKWEPRRDPDGKAG